ncbi:MAG: hypothetical protein ABI947_03585 [Chloroflexota bacterium]
MPKYLAVLPLVFVMLLSQLIVLARQAVVYAVLFYMPTCPHCRYVIDNFLPQWNQEFGDQFKVLMVDVSTEQGKTLYFAASETPGIEITSFGCPPLSSVAQY